MPERDDTDLRETVVSIMLNGRSMMPECLVKRMESIINRIISEHEEKTGLLIPLDDMELEMHIDADTARGELSFHVYISYSLHEEYLFGRETITNKDEDNEEYNIIRHFFLRQVIGVFYRQYMRILESI
mgnify:CR=1 FL=1